jgi:hypothetical protein
MHKKMTGNYCQLMLITQNFNTSYEKVPLSDKPVYATIAINLT